MEKIKRGLSPANRSVSGSPMKRSHRPSYSWPNPRISRAVGNRDVLLAVDRVAHDPARLRRPEAEGPELATALRVERDDHALGGALEDQVAAGGQGVADERRPVRPLPRHLVLVHVERAEDARLLGLAEVLDGDAGVELTPPVRQIGHVRVAHAELVGRNVEVAGLRIVDLRLPAGRAQQRRTDLHWRPAHRRPQPGILHALAGDGIWTAPGDRLHERNS